MKLNNLDWSVFLRDYWQKKPLVIRGALPADALDFLSPEELGGLALEEEVESRMVLEKDGKQPWELRRGPFSEAELAQTPASHWTLLVQGVNHWLPEAAELLTAFDAIPRWRLDDVMVSYAPRHGSVGPHYDNYDVFLIQGRGTREWRLTTQACTPDNVLPDMHLRIMADFAVEETHLLEPGDMLYLPAKVGHWGISQSDDCMTWSVGYRSFSAREMLEHFADYASRELCSEHWYQDPAWQADAPPSSISPDATEQARQLILSLMQDEQAFRHWFGQFATEPQGESSELLGAPPDRPLPLDRFTRRLKQGEGLSADLASRWAQDTTNAGPRWLHVNGDSLALDEQLPASLIDRLCRHYDHDADSLSPYLDQPAAVTLLHRLWSDGHLHWLENA